MTINFSDLVLGPCMNTFARPALVDPVSSQPGALPFEMRGIFTSVPINVQAMDGSVMSDQRTTFGIRHADFAAAVVKPRDHLLIDGFRFMIDDIQHDGQGGSTLQLRKITPEYAT